MIGHAVAGLALYLVIQSTLVLAVSYHPRHSPLGIAWTAVTAIAVFALAAGKARTGRGLHNPVLRPKGRVAAIDCILAVAVLLLNAAAGWWCAHPAASYAPAAARDRGFQALSAPRPQEVQVDGGASG